MAWEYDHEFGGSTGTFPRHNNPFWEGTVVAVGKMKFIHLHPAPQESILVRKGLWRPTVRTRVFGNLRLRPGTLNLKLSLGCRV